MALNISCRIFNIKNTLPLKLQQQATRAPLIKALLVLMDFPILKLSIP